MYDIKIYKTSTGNEPYTEWIKDLDRFIRSKINSRIARIRDTGNFGDCKHFDKIIEIRIDLGPGYRVYCGLEENAISDVVATYSSLLLAAITAYREKIIPPLDVLPSWRKDARRPSIRMLIK